MARQIRLEQDVRTFERTQGSNQLSRNSNPDRAVLPQGMSIDLGDFEPLNYDHRSQTAAPVLERGHVTCWVIVSELNMPELVN